MTDLRVGDTGTVITEAVTDPAGDPLDLAAADDVLFAFQPPGGGAVKTGAGAVADGKLAYTTLAADFDAAGTWKCQFTFSLPTGRYSVEVFRLKVGERLSP